MRICLVDGCGKKSICRNLCVGHYGRWIKGKDLSAPLRKRSNQNKCLIEGCVNRGRGFGLCSLHRDRRRRGRPLNAPYRFDIEGRFWALVDKSGPNECWLWKGRLYNGYGHFKSGRKITKSHRFSWELVNGPIPEGKMLRHRCDVRPCCNPKHLELGTAMDNMQDCISRGGRDHLLGHARKQMTEDQVRKIRDSGYTTPLHILAEQMGISLRMVQGVLVGRNYRSVQ